MQVPNTGFFHFDQKKKETQKQTKPLRSWLFIDINVRWFLISFTVCIDLMNDNKTTFRKLFAHYNLFLGTVFNQGGNVLSFWFAIRWVIVSMRQRGVSSPYACDGPGRPHIADLADCVVPGGNSLLSPLRCSQFSWSTAAKRLPEVCVCMCECVCCRISHSPN